MYGTLGMESLVYKEVWHADDGVPRHIHVRHDDDLHLTEVYSNGRRVIAYYRGSRQEHCVEGNGRTMPCLEDRRLLETIIPLLIEELPEEVVSNMGLLDKRFQR